MTKPIPPYLKLLSGEACETPPPRDYAGVEGLSTAFAEATGWTLAVSELQNHRQFDPWTAPVHPGVGVAPGSHAVELGDSARPDSRPKIGKQAASRLAAEIRRLLGEVRTLQRAVCDREAELAACVPIIQHREEDAHLASRLHGVLKGGAEAVGCTAAALYLLDDATSELKLRSAFGLPLQSLLQPARPLRGSLADLEALLGHAVVLDQPELFDTWHAPDDIAYAAAVCVPVSSPTIPLGTLWFFSAEPRDFSDRDTNLVEIIAGRLAADLERTMLVRAGAASAKEQRQLALAEEPSPSQLPQQPPRIEGWKFGGSVSQAEATGGAFYDWWTTPTGTAFVALGKTSATGANGLASASALRASLRAHAEHLADPGQILQRANRALWTASTGDQAAQAWLGRLDLAADGLCYASAGQIGLSIITGNETRPMKITAAELGVDPDAVFESRSVLLVPNQSLILCTDPAAAMADWPRSENPFDWAKEIIRQAATSERHMDRAALVMRSFQS